MITDKTILSLLRLEGVAAFGAGVALYLAHGGPWLALIPLLLVPDVSMAGYLRDARLGSLLYNLVHNWALGLAVLGLGLATAQPWLVHVGMDGVFGYGLKLPTSFQETHLGRIGKARREATAQS